MSNEIIKQIKWNEDGLVAAITQDFKDNQVLMMAWMNVESLTLTIETGYVHYYSRSREKLWKKGESSGHVQKVIEMSLDCDGDAILIKVDQTKAACHTGHKSCFFRKIDDEGLSVNAEKVFDAEEVYNAAVLKEVYDVIKNRQLNPKEGSYTNYLFDKGIDKICKKIGEESAEVIIAAKNRVKDEVVYEVSDLFYHIMVLMAEQDVSLDDIYKELKNRR